MGTWLGAARPLTWPHPGAFCAPNTQLVLTLDAQGSATLCQGMSGRTWRVVTGVLSAAGCSGGAGAGASAFTFCTGLFSDSCIVSKKNWVDGECAAPSTWAQGMAAVRKPHRAWVAAPAVSGQEGFLVLSCCLRTAGRSRFIGDRKCFKVLQPQGKPQDMNPGETKW